jgi:threonine/homoserine/homoserine lactone efflux protein
MSWGTLAVFAGVVMVAYVVPGPDWMVILRQSARNRRAGLVAAAGVQTGLCVHMAAAAIGVSTVLLSSAVAFTVLKIVGAGYLIYLGVHAIWQSRRTGGDAEPESSGESQRSSKTQRSSEPGVAEPGLGRIFGQAFLANVLNPKAALFFVSVLPQFLQPGEAAAPQVLLLGALDIGLGLLWWAVFVLLTGRLAGLMRRSGPRKILDRVTGTVLVGLGITLVATT